MFIKTALTAWVWKSEWETSDEQSVSWYFSTSTSGPGQTQEVQRRAQEQNTGEKTLSERFSTNLQKAIWLHVNLGHRFAISGDLLFIPTENVTSSLFFKSLRKAEGRCSVVVWFGVFFQRRALLGKGGTEHN